MGCLACYIAPRLRLRGLSVIFLVLMLTWEDTCNGLDRNTW